MAAGQPPNPRQFGHEFADLEQDEIAQQADAARELHDRRDGRSRATGPWLAIATRLLLVLAALVTLRFGVVRMQDWELRSRAFFHHTWQGWIGWLLLVVLSGFLFAIAARLPRSFRYRPWVPLLVGIIPLLMLAHFVLLFGVEWVDAPRILLNTYFYMTFYMTFEAQFALAIMLGVALASGFQERDG